MIIDKEAFLNEVCNLASAYLASQNIPNLSSVIANIEGNKLALLEELTKEKK